MPHHASPIKHIRQDKRKRTCNRADRSAVRTLAKKVRLAANPEEVVKMMPEAASTIDRAAKKRVIHWRTAARLKSRLAKRAKVRPA